MSGKSVDRSGMTPGPVSNTQVLAAGPAGLVEELLLLARVAAGVGEAEGGADGGADDLEEGVADGAPVVESDLRLLRVDVDVDDLRRKVEVDDANRVPAGLEHAAVGEGDAAREGPVAHGTPVDEEEEVGGAGARALGAGEVGLDAEGAALAEAGGEGLAGEHGAGALLAALGAVPLADHAPVAREDEGDARLAQRGGLDDLGDARRLGGGGLEELAARRHVEEQLAHLDHGARGAAGGGDHGLGAAVDGDAGALGLAALAGAQLEPAHRGDAGERLTAEAEGADGDEIVELADLAGGVAEDGQARVFAVHAGAVVGDADQLDAAGLDVDADAAGAGVERVLEQLLDDAGGALDDLARGDLVGEIVGEEVDRGHGSSVPGVARATASK